MRTLHATLACLIALSCASLAEAQRRAPRPIASRYKHDVGIDKDPRVIMADNFESWEDGTFPDDTWTALSKPRATSRASVVAGKVVTGRRRLGGSKVLELACWAGKGSQTAGITRQLGDYQRANEGVGPGFDEIYVRFYMQLSANYRRVRNHGANLGGRDVSRKNARWVGMSNTTDVAAHGYFYSGLETVGSGTKLQLGFYSYHCDKPGKWGDTRSGGTLVPGRWYCVERRMKLNSHPDKKDGLEECWLDGRKVISWTGVRFRKTMSLKIAIYRLETYYHGLPADFTRDKPIAVRYDNVVIARAYIGPARTR